MAAAALGHAERRDHAALDNNPALVFEDVARDFNIADPQRAIRGPTQDTRQFRVGRPLRKRSLARNLATLFRCELFGAPPTALRAVVRWRFSVSIGHRSQYSMLRLSMPISCLP